MKSRVKLFSISSNFTGSLLLSGAVMAVLCIFNEALKWDIFSPKVEKVLFGVFWSIIVLAVFGVAMTIVLGITESVRAFRVLAANQNKGEKTSESPRKDWARTIPAGIVVVIVLVLSLAFVNGRIQRHRSIVFKRLALEQMEHFGPKLASMVISLKSPPRKNVPREIHDLIVSLNNLSFVNETTLYLPDPADGSAMWGYTAWRCYKTEDGFARFFVAKEFEKAMMNALDGEEKALRKINGRTGFQWYYVIKNDMEKPVAVIRIDGNERENFRDYSL